MFQKSRKRVHFYDPEYRRLSYIRYADDWLIGIRGSYKDTEIIYKKISEFCKSIGLNINEIN